MVSLPERYIIITQNYMSIVHRVRPYPAVEDAIHSVEDGWREHPGDGDEEKGGANSCGLQVESLHAVLDATDHHTDTLKTDHQKFKMYHPCFSLF